MNPPKARLIRRAMALSLLAEIEDVQRDSGCIWSLGGAGYVVNVAGRVIYIDPYLTFPGLSFPEPKDAWHRAIPVPFPPEAISRADAVLTTHEHEDHCDMHTISAIGANTQAVLVGSRSCVERVKRWGYRNKVVTMRPGQSYRLGKDVTIDAYESNDPWAEAPITFLIKTPRGSIFHSGDTLYFGGFKKVGQTAEVDIALLNFGKSIEGFPNPFYMNAKQVVRAAEELKAKTLVPMHWDMWLEVKDDPERIRLLLERRSSLRLAILGLGQKLEF